MAEAVHRAGKLFLLHSCGNLYKVMDDLIDDVGIDAKHSFEDKILPVDDVYRRWATASPCLAGWTWTCSAAARRSEVRARTRRDPGGLRRRRAPAIALGTGNSVANYIPVQNYLAMLDEGRRWNREHFGAPAWPTTQRRPGGDGGA